jgi:hypothetical protein
MFQCVLESDNRMFGPGSRGEKNVLQPGSADTGKSSVSRRPGSLGTRGACGEAMHGKKKSSARHRTRQPNNVYLQPVSTDTSNQTQGPLHAFALYVAGVLDMMVHGDEARHDACMSTGNEFGSHVGQLYYIQFNE